MTFRVRELRRAQADIRQIVNWPADRSPQGARAWLDACDAMVARLEKNANTLGPVEENDDFEFDVGQATFKTRRGRVYRAMLFIEGDEAFILRVRGPGQAPVQPEDYTVSDGIGGGRSSQRYGADFRKRDFRQRVRAKRSICVVRHRPFVFSSHS